jgi:hypothetical protein
MISMSRRIAAGTTGGGAAGLVHALFTSIDLRIILVSVLIGIVTGALVGLIASISAPKYIQALLTGIAVGICVGVLSYYLLGSQQSFAHHLTKPVIGFVVGFLLFRYWIALAGKPSLFAPTPQDKAQQNGTQRT